MLTDEIRDTAKKNKGTTGSRTVRNVISGRIAKKYKVISYMSKGMGISRNQKAKNKRLFVTKRQVATCASS